MIQSTRNRHLKSNGARNEAAMTVHVFIFLGLTTVGAQLPPHITYPNQENRSHLFLLASPYRDLILNCDATEADPNRDFVWRKNRTHPLPPGWRPTNAIPGNNRRFPSAPFPAKSIRLPVTEIPSDPSSLEGAYECVVNNTGGVAVSAPVSITFAIVDHPQEVPVRPVTGDVGSTLSMPCSSGDLPVQFYPNVWRIGIQVAWTLETSSQGKVTSTPVQHYNDPRFIINEIGALYIRNLAERDRTASGATYICKITNPFGASKEANVVGRYTVRVDTPQRLPNAARLVYKTPDFSVAEGASFYLYCIFEDVGVPTAAGFIAARNAKFWFRDGGIYVTDVRVESSGAYMCNYPESTPPLEARIMVTVIPYPLTEDIADTYTADRDSVNVTCHTRAVIPVTFGWFMNDKPIVSNAAHFVQTKDSSTVLSILRPIVSDSCVICCSATNAMGTTRTNSRLIVYEHPSIEMKQVNGISSGDGKHYMVFQCSYKLDFRAEFARVHFTISNRIGIIDAATIDSSFGIERPAVIKGQDGATRLQLAHGPYKERNISENCTCHVEYKILKKAFAVSATTNMSTVVVLSWGPPTETLQWWMILVIAILIIIMAILTTILCLRPPKMPETAMPSVTVIAAKPEREPQLSKGSSNSSDSVTENKAYP